MKFEKRIIDPILKTIKKHQTYLTKPENLPQLAKLGFIYNTLWYAGRSASYRGVIEKNQCDDNPKYKIEMCDPKDDIIEDYIYDAWGMHVSNEFGPNWDEFSTTVLHGKELSIVEKKMLKPNKTFDEWVEILTDPNYRYHSIYKNKREVANHLLCTIGNGYGYKNGFVIYEASGADQDSTDYGDWQNAKFREDIQLVVDKIMADPDVEKVIRVTEEAKKDYEKEKIEREIKLHGMTVDELLNKSNELLKKLGIKKDADKKEVKYHPYYPICNYSIITMLDENSDPSYIKAAIEICEDILAHRDEENKSRKGNVIFAERFLKKVNNNFVEVFEEKILTEDALKLKVQQIKSSFTVEGIPLIKSNRFTQEQYDEMMANSKAHPPYFEHLKVGKKVWTDEEISKQVITFFKTPAFNEHKLRTFFNAYREANPYKNKAAEVNALKSTLYSLLGWDILTPLNSKFWTRFSSAPYSLTHNHANIGDVERAYGAVGMEDIFDDFGDKYYLCHEINNLLFIFEQEWKEK